MDRKTKWWSTMITLHGSEEAVKDFMRANANKSRRNTGGGGFAFMAKHDPERLKQIGRDSGRKRK